MSAKTGASPTANKLCRAALEYARLGWAVFPCHSIGQDGRRTCSQNDLDFQAVAVAWPTLPAAIRAGIVAMIGAAQRGV